MLSYRIYYQNNPKRLATCPVTIHALLHIADSIARSGPVWTSWAFPMERYCSALQPAITSRRFPFASINRFLVDQAQLQMIRLLYNVKKELSMQKSPSEQDRGALCLPNCKRQVFCQVAAILTLLVDDGYVLLPKMAQITLPRGTYDKVVAHVCTRFGVTPTVARRALPSEFQQWAKLRLPHGGDTIQTSSMMRRKTEDSRDVTYVRVRQYIDLSKAKTNLLICAV